MRKVSEMLREAREEKGISLVEVSHETKIKKDFLAFIEEGRFHKLPSESHALGFVKNYASFLGIPAHQAVPLFRREYKSKHLPTMIPEFRKTQHKFNRKIFFNARTTVFLMVFLIVAVYVFFQYSSLIFPPGLSVTSPKEGEKITGNVVKIVGKTDPYATVSIDGEDTYVDLSGKFSKTIYLFSGDNKINIVATNRFGKLSKKTISVKIE